jgi:hypothetical protein
MNTQARKKLSDLLCLHLSATVPTEELPLERAIRSRKVPAKLGWGPDFCLFRGREVFLIYIPSGPEVPAWVAQSQTVLRRFRNARVIIVAVTTRDHKAVGIASAVCATCTKHGFGLMCVNGSDVYNVLPPRRLRTDRCRSNGTERGHVPSWLITRLQSCGSFSSAMTSGISRFAQNYRRLTRRAKVTYDEEAAVLEGFLRSIKSKARPLVLPLEGFLGLKAWEKQGANLGARDHYFHTFNNLLLGLVIGAELFKDRRADAVPESFVGDANGRYGSLSSWEALWLITCLNHDPGYQGEKFWHATLAQYGLRGSGFVNHKMPPDIAEAISNGWDTELKQARADLLDLYRRIKNIWMPPQVAARVEDPFNDALRKAYFDGQTSSHSLLSGLTLIRNFIEDQTNMPGTEEYNRSLAALEIAALSIMFHDPRCRDQLQKNGVPPLPFEQLPFAALLVFVDALQEDRRDIKFDTWPTHGVLNGVRILRRGTVVRADVCLRELSLRYWPAKLIEYMDAVSWLNTSAQVLFEVCWKPDNQI